MARTTRKHLAPGPRAKRRHKSHEGLAPRELSKTPKQRRVSERAALRKEWK